MITQLNRDLKMLLGKRLGSIIMMTDSGKSNQLPSLFYLTVASTVAVLFISIFSIWQAIPLLVLLGMGGIVISLAQFIIEYGWIYVTSENSGLDFSNIQEKIQYAMNKRGAAWFYVQIFIDIIYILIVIMLRG